MAKTETPAGMANAIYQATVKELAAAHDPQLQREVLQQLDAMLQSAGRHAAEITSAVELSAPEQQQLEAKLRQKFGSELTFAYRVDAALLGGVVAKVGDKIIDGSLASKVNAMAETLLGGTR